MAGGMEIARPTDPERGTDARSRGTGESPVRARIGFQAFPAAGGGGVGWCGHAVSLRAVDSCRGRERTTDTAGTRIVPVSFSAIDALRQSTDSIQREGDERWRCIESTRNAAGQAG